MFGASRRRYRHALGHLICTSSIRHTSSRYPFEFVELGRGRVDLPSVLARWTRSSFVAGRWSNLITFLINRELQRSRRPLSKPVSNRRSVSLFNFLEVDGVRVARRHHWYWSNLA